MVGDAVALNQPLARLFTAGEFGIAHVLQASRDAAPVRTQLSGAIDQFIPLTVLRRTIGPFAIARGARQQAELVHVSAATGG